MDFGALLHYAKKNNDAATKDEHGKYYSTKYAPPKKESKESKQLSSNIQKFLKKREAEESERKRLEREKLSNLLAMRDEKSKNKIRKMLKVTKSANKSVLEDAKDCDNTDATLDGPDQPDGDDYGYVSTEANAFYQKYIEKVKDVHEDKGFAPSRPQSLRDLSGTKERVKAAITREREEAKSHTRQRLSSVQNTASSASSSSSSRTPRDASVARSYTTSKTLYNPEEEEQQPKKPKVKRPPQPPPMDFQALLRLAEKKQHEPISIAVPEKKKEPERLLSAREKREQEERQRWKEQRAQRDKQRETEAKAKDQRKDNQLGATSSSQSQSQSQSQTRMEPNGRIPKLNKAGTAGKAAPAPAPAPAPAKPTSDSLKRPAPTPASSGSSSAKISATAKSLSSLNGAHSAAKRPAGVANTKPTSSAASSSGSSKPVPAARLESRNPYAGISKTGATREFPPREPSAKMRALPPNGVQQQRRRPPPNDGRGGGRGPSMSTGRKQAEMGNKRRIYDEDDSEYDSELDDFIDDGDCEEDISSHIRDIFGYDKRRYRDLDEDDDQMESSFAQVQREELISKKLGLQEDLEDMRMEALHKKNKMAKKRTKRIDDDD
ncbi:hypothetical protein ACLKA7_005993 [Drosophila subpalustris]